jgi:hypothetical protein
MRYTTVYDYLQVVPNRVASTNYNRWVNEYENELNAIFSMFLDRLGGVKEDAWYIFTQYLYKKSSRVV